MYLIDEPGEIEPLVVADGIGSRPSPPLEAQPV
jgi:hypothetical protein